VKIYGRNTVTRKRHIFSSQRRILETGGEDWFFLMTEEFLGDITGIGLTVDFEGSNPDW